MMKREKILKQYAYLKFLDIKRNKIFWTIIRATNILYLEFNLNKILTFKYYQFKKNLLDNN